MAESRAIERRKNICTLPHIQTQTRNRSDVNQLRVDKEIRIQSHTRIDCSNKEEESTLASRGDMDDSYEPRTEGKEKTGNNRYLFV